MSTNTVAPLTLLDEAVDLASQALADAVVHGEVSLLDAASKLARMGELGFIAVASLVYADLEECEFFLDVLLSARMGDPGRVSADRLARVLDVAARSKHRRVRDKAKMLIGM